MVRKIESMLSEVIALQKHYVAEICPECSRPCCTKVHYLFCEKDILFFKLSGRKSRWKRETSKVNGCGFLDSTGCVLDPKSRPFECHRYICADLEKKMRNRKSELFTVLKERFKAIDEMRSQMWSEYLDLRLKPWHQGQTMDGE
ncbi:hypothetical protein ACFL03_13810 [Thermodesulfobacteriota bacterium]